MDEPGRGRRRHEHLDLAREHADAQRKRMRFSRAGLARVAGISVDTVRHFLDGKNVDDSTLVAISTALGWEPLGLVDLAIRGIPLADDDEQNQPAAELSDAIGVAVRHLRTAPEDTQREVLDYIRFKLGT